MAHMIQTLLGQMKRFVNSIMSSLNIAFSLLSQPLLYVIGFWNWDDADKESEQNEADEEVCQQDPEIRAIVAELV